MDSDSCTKFMDLQCSFLSIKKAKTLCSLTLDAREKREAIKWNLRNVQKLVSFCSVGQKTTKVYIINSRNLYHTVR